MKKLFKVKIYWGNPHHKSGEASTERWVYADKINKETVLKRFGNYLRERYIRYELLEELDIPNPVVVSLELGYIDCFEVMNKPDIPVDSSLIFLSNDERNLLWFIIRTKEKYISTQ